MLPHRSLFIVLSVAIITVVITVMGVRAFIHYDLETTKLYQNITKTIKTSEKLVSNNISPMIEAYAVNEYRKVLLNELESFDYMAVVLRDENMSILTGGDAFYVGFLKSKNATEDFDSSLDEHMVTLQSCLSLNPYFPIETLGKKIGDLLICPSNAVIEAELKETIEETILETFVTATILLILIYLIVMKFSVKPIREIVRTLEKQDELLLPSQPVKGNGFAEIEFLADKINSMVKTARYSKSLIMKERQRLSDIIWGTNVGTWEWVVPSGEVIFNEKWANILGYSLNDLQPISIETWIKFAHPEDLKKSERLLNECFIKESSFYECECRMKHKDGQWVWVLDRGKVVEWTEDGKPLRMAGTHTDITYRKNIEHDLEAARKEAVQANLAKSDFLANMSHELRTPMMGIRGVLDLMRDDAKINSLAAKLLDDLDISSKALMGLLDDILDLSKIEAGKLVLDYSVWEPAKIIISLVNLFTTKSSQKGIEIATNAKNFQGLHYKLDDLRFRQILSNLINNAVKFTEKGEIRVDMEIISGANTDKLVVRVSDTGIGMSEEAQKHIFERFQQAEAGTTKKYGGTGLGLAISNELTRLFKGSLDVESHEGKGTTFTLSIPVEKAEAVDEYETSIVLPIMNILLAEDNAINQRVVSAMLSHRGHSIEIADNGLQAVSKASESKFDLILMDMHMPEMDGIEATKIIRQAKGLNAVTPIIAFTADAVAVHQNDFKDAGVDGIITKPIMFEKLSREIGRILKVS